MWILQESDCNVMIYNIIAFIDFVLYWVLKKRSTYICSYLYQLVLNML